MAAMTFDAEDRETRWTKVSIGMIRFEAQAMMPLVQQLGRLDVKLMQADLEWSRAVRDDEPGTPDYDALHGHITLSYLWILGAYEFVRTLSQKMEHGPQKVPLVVSAAFRSTKRRFARLRMPLAKMEPASAHSNEDNHIAYPGVHEEYGVAWHLNDTTLVSRRELSDDLLEALELARREKLREQAQIYGHET